MRKSLALLALVLFSSAAHAVAPTTDSVKALLRTMHAERTVDAIIDNVNVAMKQAAKTAAGNQPQTPEQERARDALNQKVVAIYREEMSWAKLEPIYVQIYQESFSQTEIDNLAAFYRTPTGAAYIDKLPVVLKKSLVATQSMMGPLIQKVQAAVQESSKGAVK